MILGLEGELEEQEMKADELAAVTKHQTGWVKEEKFIFSWFCRQIQDVMRVSFWRDLSS